MANAASPAIEFERGQYLALVAVNPNYFGNIKASAFPSVKAVAANTTYEELRCVGFHPQINQLEAVVRIKRTTGYSGSLCSGGSQEYVRFYTSSDGGATWTDEGLAQFTAFDVPHAKPLDQAVVLSISPKRRFCSTENLRLVRAILSWATPPPPNDPNFSPVWGNVVESAILIEPRRLFSIKDLPDLKVQIPKDLPFDIPDFEIDLPIPDPLPPIELQKLYAKTKVPEARYLYKAITDQVSASGKTLQMAKLKPDQLAVLEGVKLDWTKLIKALQNVGDGNKEYEDLSCIGYDPNQDALVGVIRVKKSSGYSGKLCSGGSLEHVAWWLDWGDGTGWTYAGTSSVRVYDIASLPASGLRFAVFQPINSTAKRKACATGPVIPKIRAILSWQTPPSPSDPDWVPTWGDREETTALIPPGVVQDFRPILESVGSVPVCSIDPATGKTYGPLHQPFGGVLTITGIIPNSPDVGTPTADKLRYRIQVRELPGGAWQTVSNSFGIIVTEQIGAALPTQYGMTQSVDANGYYTYQEDMNTTGAGWRLVQNRVLARWITAHPMHGRYQIKVDVIDPVTNTPYSALGLVCPDGPHPSAVTVYLDEVAPTVGLTLTGFSRGGGPVQPAAPCGTFQVGDVLHGTYAVADEHFGSLQLYVEPAAQANGAAPVPNARAYPVVPTTGEDGTWTLNTGAMEACGYVLRLDVRDRTIQGSGGWFSHTSIGFCLKRP